MSGYSLDANIVIDALLGHQPAFVELHRIISAGERPSISRMAWIEVMSKGDAPHVGETERFLAGFLIDEIDPIIAARAAALRRERVRLKSPDAVILATAQVHNRTLVTRNTKDFPADMPGIRVPYSL